MPRLLSEEYCQTGLFTNCRTYYGSINSSANHDAANWRAIRSTDFGAYNFSPYHSRTYCRTYYGSIDRSANHDAHDSQANSCSYDYAYDTFSCTNRGSNNCHAHHSYTFIQPYCEPDPHPDRRTYGAQPHTNWCSHHHA